MKISVSKKNVLLDTGRNICDNRSAIEQKTKVKTTGILKMVFISGKILSVKMNPGGGQIKRIFVFFYFGFLLIPDVF